ncbi:unnamed protein product [Timema podura]|uniref:KATNIP domain-containing protein n=1 Tax=Timema podura TaxID=61482 RepID=A0ABN7NSF7_TIMPD|nr:unnamed protein product [Timema podura]
MIQTSVLKRAFYKENFQNGLKTYLTMSGRTVQAPGSYLMRPVQIATVITVEIYLLLEVLYRLLSQTCIWMIYLERMKYSFLKEKVQHVMVGELGQLKVLARQATALVRTMQSNIVHKPLDFGPTEKPASAGRQNKRDGYDLNLEESWSSLSFFERKHKGRLNEISPSPESIEDIVPVIQVADISKNHPSQSRKEDVDFIIPELPSGQRLDINIRSTWGDRHYLGLNGIEVFSRTGEQVPVSKIWADPADINILPEYSKDPRLVGNLLDGVNRTHDDMHLWLAPFTPGSDHYVHIIFQHTVSVAMVRIWNYNKSRIHSFRGARDVEISLDDVVVFRGEIARACGGILGGTEAFGDTILFTTDDAILELISQFDDSFGSVKDELKFNPDNQVDRPITAYNGDERPFTTAGVSKAVCSSTEVQNNSNQLLTGQKLEISLMANWGHPSLIGLAGLEILGDGGKVILVEPHYLQCSSRSPDIYR